MGVIKKTKKQKKSQSLTTALKFFLVKAYTQPKSPGSFTGVNKMLQQKQFSKLSKKDAYETLSNLDSFTRHKGAKRKFERNRVIVGQIDQQWQIDLMDMQNLKRQNANHKYVLTVIDVFSKYAWAVPIKTKSANDVKVAFEKVLQTGRKPKYVQSDKGKEFLNKTFQSLLNNNDIQFFTTENDDIKAGIVERLNRTLKEKLWRYFTHTGKYKYLDVLPDLVNSYNNTLHSSLEMTPKNVTSVNQEVIFHRLYKPSKKQIKRVWSKSQQRVVKPGDEVRLLKTRNAFTKGYEPNWTSEIFTVLKNKGKRGCIVVDKSDEEIKGVFYPEEVQKVF